MVTRLGLPRARDVPTKRRCWPPPDSTLVVDAGLRLGGARAAFRCRCRGCPPRQCPCPAVAGGRWFGLCRRRGGLGPGGSPPRARRPADRGRDTVLRHERGSRQVGADRLQQGPSRRRPLLGAGCGPGPGIVLHIAVVRGRASCRQRAGRRLPALRASVPGRGAPSGATFPTGAASRGSPGPGATGSSPVGRPAGARDFPRLRRFRHRMGLRTGHGRDGRRLL